MYSLQMVLLQPDKLKLFEHKTFCFAESGPID